MIRARCIRLARTIPARDMYEVRENAVRQHEAECPNCYPADNAPCAVADRLYWRCHKAYSLNGRSS